MTFFVILINAVMLGANVMYFASNPAEVWNLLFAMLNVGCLAVLSTLVKVVYK